MSELDLAEVRVDGSPLSCGTLADEAGDWQSGGVWWNTVPECAAWAQPGVPECAGGSRVGVSKLEGGALFRFYLNSRCVCKAFKVLLDTVTNAKDAPGEEKEHARGT